MTTWYHTKNRSTIIEPVEVIKETEYQLIIADTSGMVTRNRRTAKKSSWEQYFPSYSEAREHIFGVLNRRVSIKRLELDRATREFIKFITETE